MREYDKNNMNQTLSKNEQLKKNKPEKIKVQRFKACRYCKEKTVPWGSLPPFCFKNECVSEHIKQLKEKAHRKDLKAFNQSNKSYLIKQAQTVVNKYVRIRDSKNGCCTCGTHNGKFDSGHWLSAGGHGSVRFHTMNIHKQCFRDNRMKSGDIRVYREFMLKTYGEEFVVKLEREGATPRKYTIEYLQKLIIVFKKKIKLIEKRV